MLPHMFSATCWCRPRMLCDGIYVHRHLCLTWDPQPRATVRLIDGIPV